MQIWLNTQHLVSLEITIFPQQLGQTTMLFLPASGPVANVLSVNFKMTDLATSLALLCHPDLVTLYDSVA